MKPIYVELGDEITTVISRIREEESLAIAIVVPKGAIVIQSLVNLKLASRAARELGKTLTLVTTDTIGRNLALQAGMQAVSSLDAATETPSPESTGDSEPKYINGVRIHRYYEELDNPEAEGDQAIAPIIPKQFLTESSEESASAPEPMEPIEIPESAPLNDGNEHSPVEEAGFAMRTITSSLPSVVTRVFPKNYAQPTPPVVLATSVKPLPSTNPVRPAPVVPEAPIRPKQSHTAAVISLVVLLLVLGLAGGAAAMYLPKTVVAIAVQLPQESRSLAINASTNITQVSAGSIPAEIITSAKEQTAVAKATGKKDVGTQARGTARVINDYSTSAQTIPSGSIIAAQGMNFITQSAVTVPGFTAPEGDKIAGTADVDIVTEAAGDQANISNQPGSFTTPSTRVYAKILATTGGTSKTVTILTQADVEAVKAEVIKQASQAATDELAQSQGERLANPESDSTAVSNTTISAAVGSEVSTAEVRLSVTKKRLVINKDHIREAVALAYADTEIVTLETPVPAVALTDGAATITVATTVRPRLTIDTAAIATTIAGTNASTVPAAVDSAVSQPHTTTVRQSPEWWPFKRVPTKKSQVQVTATYE